MKCFGGQLAGLGVVLDDMREGGAAAA